ncbi:MAG: hypothetical protein QOD75_1302 [Blastocatellia bacterium]|jgi:phage tail-like protein|nr:hypothetical protein [Blastocatellia bacterium]
MTTSRKHPYAQFNFLVRFSADDETVSEAGFQECTLISEEKDSPTITLKRGVIGALDLYQWLSDIRGSLPTAERHVVITLQNEDRSGTVQTWTLTRARIVKHVSGPMNAKGTDVAMEELTVAYERLEFE